MEEVKDVKTFLKLVSLISCVTLILALEIASEVEVHTVSCFTYDFHFFARLFVYGFACSSLPIYQFLVYPFYYNYIPNMLRKVGFGMLVIALSNAALSAAKLYVAQQTYDEDLNATFTCHTSIAQSDMFSAIPWTVSASHSNTKVGLTNAVVSLAEFIAALAPSQLRGFVHSWYTGLFSTFCYFGIILSKSIPNHS